MTQDQMRTLTTDLYIGKLQLDMNSYRAALIKIQENAVAAEEAYVAATGAHITAVQAAQNHVCQSDIVFASPATGGLTVPEGIHWLTAAVQEATRNLNRVSVLAGRQNSVAVFNVVSLPTHGMLSMKLLHAIRSNLLMQEGIHGPLLVMYPSIPRAVFRARRSSTAMGSGAWGAALSSAAAGASDDSDSAEDGFTEEGQLPEVVTKAAQTMTKWERDTALARDRFEIDSVLGQHDLSHVCPKSVMVSYKADSTGSRVSERGLLLMKQPAVGGDVPANGGATQEPFEKAQLVRNGVFVEVEPPSDFVNVSKKLSMECRRSQAQGWKTEGLVTSSRHYVATKSARGQLGWQFWEVVLTDLVKHCEAPNILVNDFMAGVGEVGIAALRVKVSQIAKEAGVRVFYWGAEDRRVFAEVARANLRTAIGASFLARELVVPGLEPVAPPPPKTATGVSKEAVERALAQPLTQLSLADDGTLIIPTDREMEENPPVPATPKVLSFLAGLRSEIAAVLPSKSPPENPPVTDGLPCGGSPGVDPSLSPPATGHFDCGSTLNNRSELQALLLAAGSEGRILRESKEGTHWGLLLLRLEGGPSERHRVLIENHSAAALKLPAGTFVGRGGPGRFVSTEPEGDLLKHAWLYTRICDWKRDVSLRANGCLVFKTSPAVGGEAPATGGDVPRMQTLDEIQKELGANAFEDLWAHSITRGARGIRVSPVDTSVWWVPKTIGEEDPASFCSTRLGAWLPSRERKTDTGVECAGLLRPAFHVILDGASKKTLTPDADPVKGNALCLFLKRCIMLKPGQLIVL